MSVTLVERPARELEGRQGSRQGSLLALLRLPRLRLPDPSRRVNATTNTNFPSQKISDIKTPVLELPASSVIDPPAATTAELAEGEPRRCPDDRVPHELRQLEISATLTFPVKHQGEPGDQTSVLKSEAPALSRHQLEVGSLKEDTHHRDDQVLSRKASSPRPNNTVLSETTSVPNPSKSSFNDAPDVTSLSGLPDGSESKTIQKLEEPLRATQEFNLTLSANLKSQQVQSTKSETQTEAAFSGFKRFGKDCYVATKIQVDRSLQEEFDGRLRWRLCRILQSLKLNDTRISLDCAMIGSTDTLAAMKPTILFMCLTQDQRKAILSVLKKMDIIPPTFRYRIIVYEIKKASDIKSPLLKAMVGTIVEIDSQPPLSTLCGTLARIRISEEHDGYATSTIGGVIAVNGTLYALTTAHGFADAVKHKEMMDKGARLQNSRSEESPRISQALTILGPIIAYDWTDNIAVPDQPSGEGSLLFEDTIESQDWALVSIPQSISFQNTFPIYENGRSIEGYVRTKDLTNGEVYICCGSSGLQKGSLRGSAASILMGTSIFEVKSISLDKELVDGDSGSWVVRDGKLCGYIFCRVVGLPWAYFLPIEPVLKTIAGVFSDTWPARVTVPSREDLDIFIRSRKSTTGETSCDQAPPIPQRRQGSLVIHQAPLEQFSLKDTGIDPFPLSETEIETKDKDELDVERCQTEKTPPASAMSGPELPPDGGLETWLVVLGAWCCFFCSFGWVNSIGVFQEHYQSNQLKHYTPSNIAWIPSLEIFILFIGRPVFSHVFDICGPRYLLLAGSVVHVFGLMMTSLSTNYYQLLLSQGVCSSLGASAVASAAISSGNTWLTRKPTVALGIASSGTPVGGIIYPIMFTKLISILGFPWAMRAIAFTILGVLIIANVTVKSRLAPQPTRLIVMDYIRPLKEPAFALLVAGSLMLFFAHYLPLNYIILQAQAGGMSTNLSIYLLPIYNAASLFGRIIFITTPDKLGRYNTMTLACFTSAILVLAIWLPSRSNAPIIVFAALYGFVSGALSALPEAVIPQISDLSKVKVRTGTLYGIISFAALTGNPIGGALITRNNGGFTYLQVFCGVMLAGGGVVFTVARVLQRKRKF